MYRILYQTDINSTHSFDPPSKWAIDMPAYRNGIRPVPYVLIFCPQLFGMAHQTQKSYIHLCFMLMLIKPFVRLSINRLVLNFLFVALIMDADNRANQNDTVVCLHHELSPVSRCISHQLDTVMRVVGSKWLAHSTIVEKHCNFGSRRPTTSKWNRMTVICFTGAMTRRFSWPKLTDCNIMSFAKWQKASQTHLAKSSCYGTLQQHSDWTINWNPQAKS